MRVRVSVTPQPLFTLEKDPATIVQEAGSAPGPVWTGAVNLASTGIKFPDRPVRSQSLYRLSYPAHHADWEALKFAFFYSCDACSGSQTKHWGLHGSNPTSYTLTIDDTCSSPFYRLYVRIPRVSSVKTQLIYCQSGDMFRLKESSSGQLLSHVWGTSSESALFKEHKDTFWYDIFVNCNWVATFWQ